MTYVIFALLLLPLLNAQEIPQNISMQEIQAFLRVVNIPQNTLIVVGSNLDGPENALLATFRTQVPAAVNLTYLDDSDATLRRVENERSNTVVLLGGPGQNKVSKEFVARGWIGSENVYNFSGLFVRNGTTGAGGIALLISDARGFENLGRKGVRSSPLRFLVDEKYVPVVATGASIALMALWTLARTLFERYVLGAVRRERKITKALNLFGIKFREVASFAGATIVLALAVTWIFAGPTNAFFWLFLVNIIASFFILTGHELVHIIMGRILGLKVEYRLWWIGALATLFSAYLGNPFSLPGYLIEEDVEGARRRIGITRLAAPLFSIGIAVLFTIINFFVPNQIFQMIYTLSSTLAFVALMPFEPLAGWRVRKWNIFIWFFSFLFAAFFYITINFIL